MNVLLIIDMQSGFPGAQDRELQERIEAAAHRFDLVLQILFDDSGPSTVNVEGHVLWKKQQDGADEVYAYLVGVAALDRDLHVWCAGVNLSACVWSTAVSLGLRLRNEHGLTDCVHIVQSLCGDTTGVIDIRPDLSTLGRG